MISAGVLCTTVEFEISHQVPYLLLSHGDKYRNFRNANAKFVDAIKCVLIINIWKNIVAKENGHGCQGNF